MGRKGGGGAECSCSDVHKFDMCACRPGPFCCMCRHVMDGPVACADMSWMGAGWTFLLHVQTCHGWGARAPMCLQRQQQIWVSASCRVERKNCAADSSHAMPPKSALPQSEAPAPATGLHFVRHNTSMSVMCLIRHVRGYEAPIDEAMAANVRAWDRSILSAVRLTAEQRLRVEQKMTILGTAPGATPASAPAKAGLVQVHPKVAAGPPAAPKSGPSSSGPPPRCAAANPKQAPKAVHTQHRAAGVPAVAPAVHATPGAAAVAPAAHATPGVPAVAPAAHATAGVPAVAPAVHAPAAATAVPAVGPAQHTTSGVPAVSQKRSLPSQQLQPQVMDGDVARLSKRQVTGTCVQSRCAHCSYCQLTCLEFVLAVRRHTTMAIRCWLLLDPT